MDYFTECETMLSNFNNLKLARENLIKRKERLEASGAPKDIKSFDYSKPYVSAGFVNDTYKQLFEYGETCRELEETEKKISEIKGIVSQLPKESKKIIKLFYFDGATYEQIAERIGCWSTTTVYKKKNTAIRDFALFYYGAAAMKEV